MSFDTPEFIDNTHHICKNCGIIVKYGRASSWEFEKSSKCYYNKVNRNKIDPLKTIVTPSIIAPVIIYLNRYTPFEMERMK